mgnify:CR=1 FL=1
MMNNLKFSTQAESIYNKRLVVPIFISRCIFFLEVIQVVWGDGVLKTDL